MTNQVRTKVESDVLQQVHDRVWQANDDVRRTVYRCTDLLVNDQLDRVVELLGFGLFGEISLW